MNSYWGLALFCLIGIAAWQLVRRIFNVYEENTPEGVQTAVYKVAKDFPKIVLGLGISIAFWWALGAVLIWPIATALGVARYLPSARFAPMVLFVIGMLVLHEFWNTPHRPKETIQRRGRQLVPPKGSQPRHKPSSSSAPARPSRPASRGRTIRTYRNLR